MGRWAFVAVGALLILPIRAEEKKAGSSYGQRVRELHRSQSDGILACHKAALKDGRTIEGLVKVSWLIDRTGKVVGSKIVRSTIGDEALENCILEESKRWGFPPREGTHFIKKSRTYSFRMPRAKQKG